MKIKCLEKFNYINEFNYIDSKSNFPVIEFNREK